jgi:hypothetical protein
VSETITRSRGKLHESVRARLALATGKLVGKGTVPDGIVRDGEGKLTDPYAIVYALDATGGAVPDLESPDSSLVAPYQVTSVGRDFDHAQWMDDTCRGVFLSRDPSGSFTNPIIVADAAVIDRRLRSAGGPEPAGGGLWQVISVYELEVSA